MPLTIQQLALRRANAQLSVQLADGLAETVHFEYLPAKLTGITEARFLALQEEVNNAASEDEAIGKLAEFFCGLIVSWDIYDQPPEQGGTPLPISPETIARYLKDEVVTADFLGDVLVAAFQAGYVGKANGGTRSGRSSSTLPPTAKSTNSRRARSRRK
jgi:hypothetical protein